MSSCVNSTASAQKSMSRHDYSASGTKNSMSRTQNSTASLDETAAIDEESVD
ncbi:hypothetical protein [Allobacillus saliphilus]|uniref:hypothetical protein n=1 Tax=Allobacillus saliphilus TaxID=2912308 RepID=UPI001BA63A79|nr:hypothetical protein [Allobacillus saliphilus]